MPASMVLSYMGIAGNKDTAATAAASTTKAADGTLIENLQLRVKSLLKEPGNKTCSECRSSKPKWMSLLQTPINEDQRMLGVFVCNGCFHFHTALSEELCQLKSLKQPETWTTEDVEILEKSGNKAVNAIYESALEGNHTDKHMGALASSGFVEDKYKNCLYFTEKAYHEQMELRAKFQQAKKLQQQQKQQTKSQSGAGHDEDENEEEEQEPEFSIEDDNSVMCAGDASARMGTNSARLSSDRQAAEENNIDDVRQEIRGPPKRSSTGGGAGKRRHRRQKSTQQQSNHQSGRRKRSPVPPSSSSERVKDRKHQSASSEKGAKNRKKRGSIHEAMNASLKAMSDSFRGIGSSLRVGGKSLLDTAAAGGGSFSSGGGGNNSSSLLDDDSSIGAGNNERRNDHDRDDNDDNNDALLDGSSRPDTSASEEDMGDSEPEKTDGVGGDGSDTAAGRLRKTKSTGQLKGRASRGRNAPMGGGSSRRASSRSRRGSSRSRRGGNRASVRSSLSALDMPNTKTPLEEDERTRDSMQELVCQADAAAAAASGNLLKRQQSARNISGLTPTIDEEEASTSAAPINKAERGPRRTLRNAATTGGGGGDERSRRGLRKCLSMERDEPIREGGGARPTRRKTFHGEPGADGPPIPPPQGQRRGPRRSMLSPCRSNDATPQPPPRRIPPSRTLSSDGSTIGVMTRAGRSMRRSTSMGGNRRAPSVDNNNNTMGLKNRRRSAVTPSGQPPQRSKSASRRGRRTSSSATQNPDGPTRQSTREKREPSRRLGRRTSSFAAKDTAERETQNDIVTSDKSRRTGRRTSAMATVPAATEESPIPVEEKKDPPCDPCEQNESPRSQDNEQEEGWAAFPEVTDSADAFDVLPDSGVGAQLEKSDNELPDLEEWDDDAVKMEKSENDPRKTPTMMSTTTLRRSKSMASEESRLAYHPPHLKRLDRSTSVGAALGGSKQSASIEIISDGHSVHGYLPEPEPEVEALSDQKRSTSDRELWSKAVPTDAKASVLRALSSRDLIGIKALSRSTLRRQKSDSRNISARLAGGAEENHKRRLRGHLAATEHMIPKANLKTSVSMGKLKEDERKKRLDSLRNQYRESFRGLGSALSSMTTNDLLGAASQKKFGKPATKSLLDGDDDDDVSISSSEGDYNVVLDASRGHQTVDELHATPDDQGVHPHQDSNGEKDFEASLDFETEIAQKTTHTPLHEEKTDRKGRQARRSTLKQRERSKSQKERGKSKDKKKQQASKHREQAAVILRHSEHGKEGTGVEPEVAALAHPETAAAEAKTFKHKNPQEPSSGNGKNCSDAPVPGGTECSPSGERKQSSWTDFGFNDTDDFLDADMELSKARLVPVSADLGCRFKLDGSASKTEFFELSSNFDQNQPSREDLGYGSMDESAPDSDCEYSLHSHRTEEASSRHLLTFDHGDENDSCKDFPEFADDCPFLADMTLESDKGYYDTDESGHVGADGARTVASSGDFRRRSDSSLKFGEDQSIDPLAVSTPTAA